MKVLKVKNHKFKIVNEVPDGYFIWCIGTQNMVEGYIPLCQWLNDDKENYAINTKTLKAIKVDNGWFEIMEGVLWANSKSFDKLVRYANSIKNEYKKAKLNGLIKYLPQINGYERISWKYKK